MQFSPLIAQSTCYAGKAFHKSYFKVWTRTEERFAPLCIFSSGNNANRLFLTFWPSKGPSFMAETLKCGLDQAILLDFPAQIKAWREKAELKDGTDCVQLSVVYLFTTFLKKLNSSTVTLLVSLLGVGFSLKNLVKCGCLVQANYLRYLRDQYREQRTYKNQSIFSPWHELLK